MLRMERQDLIVQLANKSEFITIKELVKEIGSSPATIRRDIDVLASEGRLSKTRGGVVSSNRYINIEPPYNVKRVLNIEEKIRIAVRASKLISEGDHIALDSGSTTLELAKRLNSKFDLKVVTNDLLVALEITKNRNVGLIFAGGLMRKDYFASYGIFCVDILKQLRVQKTFVATDAVDCNLGLMSYIPDDIDVKKTLIDISNENILLCDHTKFEIPAYINVCSLNRINKIITGRELNETVLQNLREAKIDVELV
ncbi:MAG: DeoR/GlpR family DNA-binding transcription regulator [Eubacteriales bacterium]|nr:DeoR/GlpR family DNA-binding transcription regulator [Eubacteriales bacterium]